MSDSRGAIEYRRLRAPRNHGERLIDPPLDQARALLDSSQPPDDAELTIGGQSLRQLQAQARCELLAAAAAYTRSYRDVANRVTDSASPIIMTGHQPHLYHPGVWIKNFVLARLAAEHNTAAVHLLIDNDNATSAGIRVPTGTLDAPRNEVVTFDDWTETLPYEEQRLRDRERFRTFADRVQSTVATLVPDPLVRQLWPAAIEAADAIDNPARCLARARHRLEGKWGLETLELPLSHVCDTRAFRRFLCELLLRAEPFQAIYNEALQEYRRVNRVRSRTHPAPSLVRDDRWIEVPFWVWSVDQPRRRPLFARQAGSAIQLSNRHEFTADLELASGTVDRAIEQLEQLADRGIKFRPRALTTTMYARLVLSDLFIHGIGGAKYDQLTDHISRQFFGVDLPPFLTVTATAWLPVERPDVIPTDLREIEFLLRELRFNPQRHVQSDTGIAPLLQEKQRLLTSQPDAGPRRQWHSEVVAATERLWPFVANRRSQLEQERQQIAEQLRVHRILASREYSFCLFPEAAAKPLLLDK